MSDEVRIHQVGKANFAAHARALGVPTDCIMVVAPVINGPSMMVLFTPPGDPLDNPRIFRAVMTRTDDGKFYRFHFQRACSVGSAVARAFSRVSICVSSSAFDPSAMLTWWR